MPAILVAGVHCRKRKKIRFAMGSTATNSKLDEGKLFIGEGCLDITPKRNDLQICIIACSPETTTTCNP